MGNFNLKTVTVSDSYIEAFATDKDNNEKHFLFAHSIVDKKSLEDEHLLKMELQQKINKL
jgi:hypothetical protein